MHSESAGSPWRLVRPALVAERWSVAGLAAWSLVEAAPVIASGHLVASAVDKGFLAGELLTGLGFLGGYALLMLIGAIGTRQAVNPLAVVVESIRDHVVRRLVDAGLRAAVRGNGDLTGSTVTRMVRHAELVRQLSGSMLVVTRSVLFSVLGVALGLVALVPELAWLTVGSLLASGILLAVLSRVLRRRYRTELVAEETMAATMADVLSGLRDVRACGAANTSGHTVGSAVNAQARSTMATARAGAGRIGVVALGARLPLLASLLAAPALVRSGAATPGQILGACTYFVTSLEPALRQIVNTVGNSGLRLSSVLRRLAEFTVLAPVPASGDRTGAGLGIELRNVTFAYGPHSAPILRDVSLTVGHGEHLAVVGPSGIGKSTVAGLITGAMAPSRGSVRLGGVELSELDPGWLHQAVALVPQEHYVFAGTLRENLLYLNEEVGESELEKAIDLLGLRRMTDRVGGLDHRLGPADSLSQGELQLITLARVYLSRAGIILLDEASCHLDQLSEARVEEAFIARGGTLIVIAHRNTSALHANRILVLDGVTAQLRS